MFVTTHVLAGAVIGMLVRRPVVALTLGVGSHLALDAVPHWGGASDSAFLAVAVVDGLLGLVVMAAAWVWAPRGLRRAVLAGMTGAALPDLDKPAALFLGIDPWPAAISHLHSAVQQEAPGRWWVDGLTGLALGAALARLLAARPAARAGPARGVPPTRGVPPAQGVPPAPGVPPAQGE